MRIPFVWAMQLTKSVVTAEDGVPSVAGRQEREIMKIRLNLISKVFCLCAATAACAQGPCTLQSLTGTYAFYEKGSSSILAGSSATYPYHWGGAVAPFLAIGEVTFSSDGIGRGFYWIRIGSFNSGSEPTPVEVTATELTSDCTGRWEFGFNLLGTVYTIEERFVISDNGRQFRSIPTNTGVPTMAWVGEGHRISKPNDMLANCGSHTLNGSYLITGENLVKMGAASPILSDAVLLRLDFSSGGEVAGTLYEKMGPTGDIQLPVWGTFSIEPDCSFTSSLNAVVQGNPTTIRMRGILFDEGKEIYALNVNDRAVGTQYSFAQGQRIGPE